MTYNVECGLQNSSDVPTIAVQGTIGEVYNIGTQKERTVKDVARQIAKIFKMSEVHSSFRPVLCQSLFHDDAVPNQSCLQLFSGSMCCGAVTAKFWTYACRTRLCT